MAEIKKTTSGGAIDDLKWFLGILTILGLAWFISGGYKREEAPKPFIQSSIENSERLNIQNPE